MSIYCPRLEHNVRLNPNGTVSKCGHMVDAPEFASFEELQHSIWLNEISNKMLAEQWPNECIRCAQTEKATGESIRTNMLKFDRQQTRNDYLVVGGVLDNICNSACQMCNENLSTKIGSLITKDYLIVDNTKGFWALPQDRIAHLDLNGGEPSFSKNYKQILANLPPNVESVRLNTNCTTVLEELIPLADRGIKITVTVSFDGVGPVHDYVRWPIKWQKFKDNLMTYRSMPIELNLWTTVNVLNIGNMPEISKFVADYELDHSWAFLNRPSELNIEYANHLTLTAKEIDHPSMVALHPFIAVKENNQLALDSYIARQDRLRGIDIRNYIKEY